ncbi:helitron_like_N domain-containing protein [Trichonephila clavata]|uniref:Helitron_like_N domain-containing protein n=1 Tax=Trichonephila clavata TaxID=2740835 RepID=A0A8X6H2D4_TRICU|nr:helitron_like_N domain-containing protein [Trichonephila clavata]
MYSIEWQKREQPYMHLLVWLQTKICPDQVDSIISAEIPGKEEDPILYEVVTKNMIHGPFCNRNSKTHDALLMASAVRGFPGKCCNRHRQEMMVIPYTVSENQVMVAMWSLVEHQNLECWRVLTTLSCTLFSITLHNLQSTHKCGVLKLSQKHQVHLQE